MVPATLAPAVPRHPLLLLLLPAALSRLWWLLYSHGWLVSRD